ncbi:hypothetical protein QQ045_008506 [Rhodiola kirilowii]
MCPTEDEVCVEIGLMKEVSAPGPDFSGRFYITFWDVIKDDLMKAVKGFFFGPQLPNIISATFLTLIPKVQSPSGIEDLRPISLCNFIHKDIISHCEFLNLKLSAQDYK